MESVLQAAGIEMTERAGARVGLKKDTKRIVIHRPHPGPEVGRATIRTIARFLEDVGVMP